MVAFTGRVPAGYKYVSGQNQPLNLSKEGALLVAQLNSPLEVFTRYGRSYCATSATATEVAPVTAVPTTAAAWVLYNPAGNERDLVIDAVFCWSV